jgi:hypothetical protein
MKPRPDFLDGDLLDIAIDAARHLEYHLPLDIGYVRRSNRAIAATAHVSASRASLAFRVVSNAVRLREATLTDAPLAASPAYGAAIESLAQGRLIVTGLDAARTTASSRPDGSLSVEASNVMVTGVRFADYLLLEATIDDDSTTSLLMVPITSVCNVRRPALRGLHDADNAVVDVVVELSIESALMSRRGHGRAAVEAPYRVGLTLGAVALGSMRALCDIIQTSPRFADDPMLIGWAVAQTQAVAALVEASASAYGNGQLLSRAAKVFATKTAEELALTASRVAGAPAYGADHPLTRIANDVAGLCFQAPTNDGSLLYLARSASLQTVDSDQSGTGQPETDTSTNAVLFNQQAEHVAS